MKPRTHVFAVAIEKYQDASIKQVAYSENDAREFVEAWKGLGADAADCKILLSANSTLATFRSKFKKFLYDADADDLVVFFYAGHGAAFNNSSYITVYDTQRGDMQATSIPLSEILHEMEASQSSRLLLFIDSCHSGLPINSNMRSIYSKFSTEELKAFCKKSEFHVAFASSKLMEASYSSVNLKHGIWSHCVIQALQGKVTNALEQGSLVTSNSLQSYLAVEVPRLLRITITGTGTQTPVVFGNLTSEFIIADLTQILQARQASMGGPVNLIKDASLIGEVKGEVKRLSGYRKPRIPLSTHSSWEEKFVASAGAEEVSQQAEDIVKALRTSFKYKRKDVIFTKDISAASIKTPDFDVNITLMQDPEFADSYVLVTEVATFRQPQIIESPEFLRIFSTYCNTVVIELSNDIDIESKIDEIEDIEVLAPGLDYDSECTEFTLKLPGSGIVLRATVRRLEFSLPGHRDLGLLIKNTHRAVMQLAGANVTLGLTN